ncbi:2OG-Fe(II) oxygenase superfamily protein [Viridothelium virens]|uniref:2OG-Fe(II) oxygenase superfamily protein n=1 Tax=Viridothelium virens TaxID=1048519 RepID=A0A6A6HFK6_VIRVR|nr:2OG-Fe(II) oxygenase superfamily protein [Viridothelium virens]
MPSAIPKQIPLPSWTPPAKTQHELPWAELSVIDLSQFDSPGGKEKLADQLKEAVSRDGFFSVTGTDIPAEEVNRQYAIATAFFNLPFEERGCPESRCDFAKGNYFGYRAMHEKKMKGTDILDNVESINIPKYIPSLSSEPRHPFLEQFSSELEAFQHRSFDVVRKIFTLFALILELPASYFVDRHLYDDRSEDHLRYMRYHPRSLLDDAKIDNTWSRSHTDFGSLTLLWSQNVAGLQIKTHDGDWRYVRPVDGGIICNVGDTLSFWSAGYFKSTIHRVVRPPPDQDGNYRVGLFYFVRPGDEVDIAPAPSPLLKRMGMVPEDLSSIKPVKGYEYVRERVRNYHDHQDYADRKGQKFRVGDLEIEDEVA